MSPYSTVPPLSFPLALYVSNIFYLLNHGFIVATLTIRNPDGLFGVIRLEGVFLFHLKGDKKERCRIYKKNKKRVIVKLG